MIPHMSTIVPVTSLHSEVIVSDHILHSCAHCMHVYITFIFCIHSNQHKIEATTKSQVVMVSLFCMFWVAARLVKNRAMPHVIFWNEDGSRRAWKNMGHFRTQELCLIRIFYETPAIETQTKAMLLIQCLQA